MEKRMFNIGKLVNTHGINGEVRVIKITDFVERFHKGNEVYWVSQDQKEIVPLTIDGYRTHKNFHLLHFKGYDSINEVERFKGGKLKIYEEQLTDLDQGEFYYHQIIGCEVYTVDNQLIGVVKEILSPGANDIWVVRRKGQKDVLIPYIDEVVKEVLVEEQKIVIEPMEGLLD